MLKHFFQKKLKNKLNQTAFAGSEKKIIQDWTQCHVAYCPITLRRDKQT